MDLPLTNLAALALDCQTTGPNAIRDALLEIGWVPVGTGPTGGWTDPFTCLVTLPQDVELSPRVTKLTGIQAHDLHMARSPKEAWRRLVTTAAALPATPGGAGVVLIHYARFERPFLRRLHTRFGGGQPFPLQIVCTHAIARRLLPHLPRCGLRALAGYFGLTVGNLKRAAIHARATRFIWAHLVPLLAAEGIREWSALKAWLATTAPPRQVPKRYPMPRALRLDVPDCPGVYRLRRSNGDLLYVGKSGSLKRRINSYFQTRRGHGEHILEMLTQAQNLDYTPTATTLEAALLETDLIQQYAPPYNILLQRPEADPVFCTTDFQTAGTPDRPERSVGPLPSKRAMRAFGFVVAQCGHSAPTLPAASQDLAVCFDIPAERLPPKHLLADALAFYRTTYGHPGDLTLTGWRLLKRARVLWHLDRNKYTDTDAIGEQTAADAEDAREWTPADVRSHLDGVIRRGGHLVRRGRWFRILANATLRWESGAMPIPQKRTLIIQDGRVRFSADAPDRPFPWNPLLNAPGMARRQIFSAATYARLRVLTTELRRVVDAGRRIHFRPAIGGGMDHHGLQRVLNLI